LLELLGALTGRRVTVADRYDMKRKVRELRRRDKEQADLRNRITDPVSESSKE
jgi:hypothetical protein